jgi:aminopeptidase YwaD
VYQNPSKKEISIEKTSNCYPTEVTIFDANGKLVATQKTENTQKNTINTGSLTTGLYILTIKDDTNSISTHKLLIE